MEYPRYLFQITNGAGAGLATTLPLNSWKFVVSTWDGNTVRTYIDGTLVGSGLLTGTILPDNNPVTMGIDTPGSTEYLNGYLDDIRVTTVRLHNRKSHNSTTREAGQAILRRPHRKA